MGLYQVLLMGILGFQAAGQTPPLNPFALGREEAKAGNPLKQFAELLRRESEFAKPENRSNYLQALATLRANLGDIEGANRVWAEAMPRGGTAKGPLLSSNLDSHRRVDAVREIVRMMEGRQVIMLGEEHVKPQSRTVLKPLLRELRKKGFTYLAAETLNDDLAETVRRGYTLRSTGTYTADPVFAEGVREALRLGFKLVPYECIERPPAVESPSPEYYQNFRELGQAKNLKTRIFDVDPKAKVIVWAGRAHVYEGTAKDRGEEWRPMAYCFKQLTGIDPLSVYLASHIEDDRRNAERPEYRYATHKGWVPRPTVFVGKDGKAFGDAFDVTVFFPRTRYVEGRPDWLMRDLGRVRRAIPPSILSPNGLQLVQAYFEDEVDEAVPMDQILIEPGSPVPALMLPRGGKFFVRAIDPDGKVLGTSTIRT